LFKENKKSFRNLKNNISSKYEKIILAACNILYLYDGQDFGYIVVNVPVVGKGFLFI